jgi:PAS domain S-box-containing protein
MVDGNDSRSPRSRLEQLERRLQGLQAENAGLVDKLIESRRREESLAETVVSYQRGLEGSGICLAIVDGEMTILDANEAIERLTGRDLADLREKVRWTDLVHPADRERLDFFLSMRAESPEDPPRNYEFRLTDAAGNHRSVIVNVRPIPRTAKYVTTFIDVSLLKRTEQALRDTEEKYLALFNNALDLIYVLDFEGRFLDANEQALRALGYRRHEVQELHIVDLLHPDHRQRAMAQMGSVREHGRLEEITEWKLARKGGGEIWVELTATRVDRDGKPYAVIAIARDVTERHRAEQALRESEERFRAMFDNASEMIYMYDRAGRFVDMNDRGLELLGIARSEIRSTTIRDIVDPEDAVKVMRGLDALFSEGESLGPTEMRLRLEDGTRRWMEVSSVRMDLGDRRHVALGIARDVTPRREAEDMLKQAEEQVRASQKMEAVGRMASGLAHEFSNILNVVSGHADLILEGLHEQDPMREGLEEIRAASKSGVGLTKQLLAFGSSQRMRTEVVDINECVRGVTAMIDRLIGDDVKLVTRLGDIGRVRTDAAKLEQVIVNLAVNAREAMKDGGELIVETYDDDLDDEYASTHAGVRPGGYVILAVTDTGEGMDEKTRQHIFEPFFTTRDRNESSGMGLSTVFGIVKQCGGNVWVYSEPGQGSTFKIYLPRLDDDEEPVRDSRPDVGSLQGRETVLVVEDEDMVRNIFCLTLREHGYTVLEARTGEEALEIFERRAGAVDVVVSDVVMPGISGRELAERLASNYDHTRILLVSGYPGTAAEHRKLVDRGVEFVSKPVPARTLVARIRVLLDRPQD